MILLTIQDDTDSVTFGAQLITPITYNPEFGEADVVTIDGNVSTYYAYTKRFYEIQLLPMDQQSYAELRDFLSRQYQNLRYPRITIEGAQTLNVENMTARMTLNQEEVVNACGMVDNIKLTFRESKQLA